MLEEQMGTHHNLAMRKPCENHAKTMRNTRGVRRRKNEAGREIEREKRERQRERERERERREREENQTYFD